MDTENIPIEHLLTHLAESRGVEVSESVTSWYDPHGTFPLITQRINYPLNGWTIEIAYEMRMSIQSHREAEANGALDNVYLWVLTATKEQAPTQESFVISKGSWATAKKHLAGGAKVKSLDAGLLKALKGIEYVSEFYELFELLPHVRVAGNVTDDGYEINTAVNTIFEHQRVAYGVVRLLEEVVRAV